MVPRGVQRVNGARMDVYRYFLSAAHYYYCSHSRCSHNKQTLLAGAKSAVYR